MGNPRPPHREHLPGWGEEERLLHHPDLAAKPADASFEPGPSECEASALTAELTAPNHTYSSLKTTLVIGVG